MLARVVLAVAVSLPPGRALAQAQVPPEWLAPAFDADPANLPTFRRERQRPGQGDGRDSVAQVPTYGIPPGSGAGRTGFDSAGATGASDTSFLAGPPDTVPAGRSGAPPVLAPSDDDFAPDEPARRRPRRGDTEDPYDPLGIRFGTLLLRPALELSGGFDTNPDRNRAARGGAVAVIAPELQVESDWSRHAFRADLRGRYTTYPGFAAVPSLDQPAAETRANARIDVTRDSRIDLEGRLALRTENPNSPDLQADVAELPFVFSRGATVGLARRFNRLELGVAGDLDRVEYGDSKLTDGTRASNRVRNFTQHGLRLRGGYELTPGVTPFVEVGIDQRKHDSDRDAFGVQRDSTGRQISLGTTVALPARLTGTVSVGYATRRYKDPTLKDLSGLIANGSLAWSMTPLTTVTLRARSLNDESTLVGVSGVQRRELGVQIDHAFRRWLIATVRFDYGLDRYVGSPREDHRYEASALLTYKLSREVWLKGEVRRAWQDSNLGTNYSADIFLLGLRLQR